MDADEVVFFGEATKADGVSSASCGEFSPSNGDVE